MSLYDEILSLVKEEQEVIEICEINFIDSISEESIDVDINKIGKCKITIYSGEGNYIPHFHIKSINAKGNSKKFECVVMINKNMFFTHGKYKDTLNSKQQKQLKEKLSEKYNNTDRTIWQHIQDQYYENNKGCKDKKAESMPDYSNILPYKS